MKQIEPIQIWDNGQIKEAVKLNAYAVNVTLNQSAQFYYYIATANNETLAQGNINMDTEDYQNWNNDDVAWNFIAEKLNLVIVGDYVEPIIENNSNFEENIITE